MRVFFTTKHMSSHHCCRPEKSKEKLLRSSWVDGYLINVVENGDYYTALVGHREFNVTLSRETRPFEVEDGLWTIAVTSVCDRAFTGWYLMIRKDHASPDDLFEKLEKYVNDLKNDPNLVRRVTPDYSRGVTDEEVGQLYKPQSIEKTDE